MKISPLHPLFVGEVTDLDLRDAIKADLLAELIGELDTYGALVFRGQSLDDKAQIRFSELFGPLETTRRAHRPGHKLRLDIHVSDISNLDETGEILEPTDYRQMSSLANRLWHTDSTFKRIPARYSILSAHTLPSEGGETELADMRTAYDDLTEARKSEIADYVCEHSIFNSRAMIGFSDFTEEEHAALPPVPQVLVRTRPGIEAQEPIPCVSRWRHPRLAATGSKDVAPRSDGTRDPTQIRLHPPLADWRRADVGQPVHHASWTLARPGQNPRHAPHHGIRRNSDGGGARNRSRKSAVGMDGAGPSSLVRFRPVQKIHTQCT
jgi:alpha-ketoglutarate-dependent taurine dioxygenase